MNPENILKEVQSIIKAGVTYLKGVYYGKIEGSYASNFPLVYLEPDENSSVYGEGYKENTFAILIGGAVHNHNPELGITGSASIKGMLDLEKDIKAALMAKFPDLNCKCLSFTLSTIGYDANAKIRWCSIRMEIKYRE